MSRSLPRPVAPLAAALACACGLWASAPPAHAAPVASHAQSQSAAELAGYWTPQRMAAAEPVGPPPEILPAVPGDGPAASAAAQPPDQETDPARDTTFPQRLHGKLFITFGSQDGTCSATVVRSRTSDVILTAGHCVVQPGGGGFPPQWATNVAFVPAYRDGATPLGIWPARQLRAPGRWVREPLIELDMAAAKLAPSAFGPIQDVLGARGVSFNRPRGKYRKNRTRFAVWGYPAEPSAFYDGERLIFCHSPFKGFERFSGSPVIGACNQKQGSSGGGWVLGGRVNSIISRGPCPTASCTRIAGTYFGDAAFKVWASAGGGVSKGVKKKLKRCKKKKRKKAARLACRGKVQNFKPVTRSAFP